MSTKEAACSRVATTAALPLRIFVRVLSNFYRLLINIALPNTLFDQLGLPRLFA